MCKCILISQSRVLFKLTIKDMPHIASFNHKFEKELTIYCKNASGVISSLIDTGGGTWGNIDARK